MRKMTLIWLVLLTVFASQIVFSAPVTNLNLTLDNPPASSNKDLNFNLTWNGGDGNVLYWQFDTDGNVTVEEFDQNRVEFFDDFSDATLSNRYSNTANFSVVSGVLEGSGASTGQMFRTIRPGHVNDYNISNFDVNVDMSFDSTIVQARFYAVADKTTIATMQNSFFIELNNNGNIQVKYEINNGGDVTILNTPATTGSNHTYNITRVDGNTTVFQDGDILVSTLAFDVNFTNHVFYMHETTSGTPKWDNVDMNYVVTGEDSTIPQSSPQNQIHAFTTAGAKRIQATVQNVDGNASTFLDLDVTGSFKATVWDENASVAIVGATIDFNSGTYTTDALGQVNIPLDGLTAGEFTISVDVNADFPQRQFIFDLNQFSSEDLNLLMLETNKGASRSYTIYQPDETTLITNSMVEWRRTVTIPNGISQRTKTDGSGQLTFFGQQDADYVMRITDTTDNNVVRDYNGTVVTIKKPLNITDITQELTPFDVTVGGLAQQSFEGLTDDVTFNIFSDTTDFYKVAVDFNADFFGTNFLVQTRGGLPALEIQPYLVPILDNLASIIFTIDNINQKQTIPNIRIVSETIVDGSLTEVESRLSDITGTAEFHFEIGRDYILSFFDADGELIFSGTLTAKSVDTTLFAALSQQTLFGEADPTAIFNLSWIPVVSQVNPVDQNVTITNIINPFNTVIGDVNVFISHLSDSNIVFEQVFTLDSSDQNQAFTYDLNVAGFDDNFPLVVNVQVFDVNGIQITTIQVKKYSFKTTRITGAFETLKEELGAFPVMFFSIVISAALIGLITLFSPTTNNNWIGVLAMLVTAFFVIITWIPLEAWLVSGAMGVGMILWRDREQ